MNCIFCGAELNSSKKYICTTCNEKRRQLRIYVKLNKAINKTKKSHTRVFHASYDFEKERLCIINKIKTKKFDFKSTEEMCVALLAEKEGIKYIPNYRIGPYTVDFLFPELKVFLEIDGSIYHTDNQSEILREKQIVTAFNNIFSFIRIDATEVPNCLITGLKDSIDYVLSERIISKNVSHLQEDTLRFIEFSDLQKYLLRKSI